MGGGEGGLSGGKFASPHEMGMFLHMLHVTCAHATFIVHRPRYVATDASIFQCGLLCCVGREASQRFVSAHKNSLPSDFFSARTPPACGMPEEPFCDILGGGVSLVIFFCPSADAEEFLRPLAVITVFLAWGNAEGRITDGRAGVVLVYRRSTGAGMMAIALQ